MSSFSRVEVIEVKMPWEVRDMRMEQGANGSLAYPADTAARTCELASRSLGHQLSDLEYCLST